MPPRRSSRAPPPKATAENNAKPTTKAASKPAAKAATKSAAKPASKPVARGRSKAVKRPASPENSPPPPAKRSRHLSKLPSNGVVTEENPKAEVLKAAVKKAAAPRARKVATEPVSYFNSLPTPPEHHRPAPQMFTWGACGHISMLSLENKSEYSRNKESDYLLPTDDLTIMAGQPIHTKNNIKVHHI